MKKLLFSLLILSTLCARPATMQWTLQDHVAGALTVRKIYQEPIYYVGVFGTNFVTGDRRTITNGTPGVLWNTNTLTIIVTNLYAGALRTIIPGPYKETILTNTVPDTNGFVLATDYTGVATNLPQYSFAYSQAVSDSRYIRTNLIKNYIYPGSNVTFVTNANGTVTVSSTGGGSGSATNVFFLNSPSVTWSTTSSSNVAALASAVSNDWKNYTLAASNSITANTTNFVVGTSNSIAAGVISGSINAATATTASNVTAAVTNDWRNYTLAASNSLYSTIVTQECVEVFTSDTNRIYATLAGTAAANGTYHWNASLVSYTNTTGCGIYTDDIDFFITNASSLYVGVGNNFDVAWDVDTGGSPPPVTRFGTNSTVYCADIPAAFQSISFNSNALYLSVGGNDLFAVRGNPIRPWKTFSACLTNAVQGDVVFVGPGTFTNHLGSGATTRASIIGSGKTTTTIHGPILTVGGSNIMFKDFTYDAYTFIQGYLKVSGTNIFFDNLKILGQQDGIFMQGWDNFKGANLSIESEWDCIADYQWATAQRSNAVAQFYNCDLFSRDIGNSFPPTCVSVGSSQLKFFGGSMVASNGGAGFTSCLFAQAGGSAAAHLGRITLANVSLLAASTNGAAYSLRWATNGQIFTAGMSISPDRISGSPLITSLDSGADLFPGIIISTNTGSSINSVGLTNGNVTIPGTLSVSGTTTAGTIAATSVSGNGSGLTNPPYALFVEKWPNSVVAARKIVAAAWTNMWFTTNATYNFDNTSAFTQSNTFLVVNAAGAGRWRIRGHAAIRETAGANLLSGVRVYRHNNTPATLLAGDVIFTTWYTAGQPTVTGVLTLTAGDIIGLQVYGNAGTLEIGYPNTMDSSGWSCGKLEFERQ